MANLIVRNDIELKSGWEWIKSAFYTFREYPVHFIVLSVIAFILGFTPLFGAFITPLFAARFADIASRIDRGETVWFSSLFNNFFANITLVRLSFLNFTLNAILFIGQYLLEQYYFKGSTSGALHDLLMLVFFLPILVLQISMWLSPVICLNNPDIRPASAMWLSLKVGLYNIATYLLYSLLVLVFTLLAILPIGLGLFIWLPVLNITSYYIYKQVIKVV